MNFQRQHEVAEKVQDICDSVYGDYEDTGEKVACQRKSTRFEVDLGNQTVRAERPGTKEMVLDFQEVVIDEKKKNIRFEGRNDSRLTFKYK